MEKGSAHDDLLRRYFDQQDRINGLQEVVRDLENRLVSLNTACDVLFNENKEKERVIEMQARELRNWKQEQLKHNSESRQGE